MVWLYDVPTEPLGNKRLGKFGKGLTLICKDADLDGSPTEVAVSIAPCVVVMLETAGAV